MKIRYTLTAGEITETLEIELDNKFTLSQTRLIIKLLKNKLTADELERNKE